jgi:hypothetical protein
MREAIVSELTSRGWNTGADQVQKYNQQLQRTQSVTMQSASSMQSLTSTLSGIMAGMGGLVYSLQAVYGGFQRVMGMLKEYQEVEDATAIITRNFGLTSTQAINMLTQATHGQVESYQRLAQASNILLERTHLNQGQYTEFLALVTEKSQQMGSSVEENLSRVATAIASGNFRNSLLEAGFMTEGLKEKFQEASTDTERFNLLLQDLRATVGEGEMSVSDQFQELSVEIEHLASQSILQLVAGITESDENFATLTEAIRDNRVEIERSVTQLTVFIRSFRELWDSEGFKFMRTGGLTGLVGRGISGIYDYFSGGNETGTETIETGLRQEAEGIQQIAVAEQARVDALNLLSTQGSVLTGAQGTEQTINRQSGGRASDEMMVFTEEELADQERRLAEVWQEIKQYEISQLDTSNQIIEGKTQEHMNNLLIERQKSNDYENLQSEQLQQSLQLTSQQNQEILSQNSLSIEDINLAFGDTMSNQIQNGTMKISDNLLITANNIKIFAGAAGSAMSGFAQGFTKALVSWAKGEKSFKAAMRDMAATVLMSLGEQSLVQAIMETGQGIAAIARYDYGSAALHFAAAATFGIIAGMTLPAGIALSANSAKTSQSATTQSRERTSSATQTYGGSTQSGTQTVVVNNYWNGNPLLTQRDIEETIYSGYKKAAIRHAT